MLILLLYLDGKIEFKDWVTQQLIENLFNVLLVVRKDVYQIVLEMLESYFIYL